MVIGLRVKSRTGKESSKTFFTRGFRAAHHVIQRCQGCTPKVVPRKGFPNMALIWPLYSHLNSLERIPKLQGYNPKPQIVVSILSSITPIYPEPRGTTLEVQARTVTLDM